jgi:hypothetical protein
MYNYLDYENDRYKVRDRFVNHMNKKSGLEDIGRTLDKFVLDSKAKVDPEVFEQDKHILE